MTIFNSKLFGVLNETTTAGDIAFIPSQLGEVSGSMKAMLRSKKNWKIKVWNDPIKEEYHMDFEGNKIRVAHRDFKGFESYMRKLGKVQEIDGEHHFSFFSNLIKEALQEDTSNLSGQVRDGLLNLLSQPPCKDASQALGYWLATFKGQPDQREQNCAIKYLSAEQDIDKLMTDLEYEYDDDPGLWQIAAAALEQYRPLKPLAVFGTYKFLYGQAISSLYQGCTLVLVSWVDMNLIPHEKIQFIGPEEVLEEIDGFQGCKVFRNEIYPKAKHFPFQVFTRLKQEIAAAKNERPQ